MTKPAYPFTVERRARGFVVIDLKRKRPITDPDTETNAYAAMMKRNADWYFWEMEKLRRQR